MDKKLLELISSLKWDDYNGFYNESTYIVKNNLLDIFYRLDEDVTVDDSYLDLKLWEGVVPHIFMGNGNTESLVYPVSLVLLKSLEVYKQETFILNAVNLLLIINEANFRFEYNQIAPPVNWNIGLEKNFTSSDEMIYTLLKTKTDFLIKEVYPKICSNGNLLLYMISFINKNTSFIKEILISSLKDDSNSTDHITNLLLAYSINCHLLNKVDLDNNLIEIYPLQNNRNSYIIKEIIKIFLGHKDYDRELLLESLYDITTEEKILWCSGKLQVLSSIALLKMNIHTKDEYQMVDQIIDALVFHKERNERKSLEILDEKTIYEYMCEDVMGFVLNRHNRSIISTKDLSSFERYVIDQFRKRIKAHTFSQIKLGLLPELKNKKFVYGQLGEIYNIY